MIISPERRRKSALQRLLSWTGVKRLTVQDAKLCDETQFRFEIEKEISRVDRRKSNPEFSIILVSGLSGKDLAKHPDLLKTIYSRLRITDCVGWCEGKFGLLLPETDRPGAKIVAADLFEIAANYSLDVTIEIIVYPEDDYLAQNSIEIQNLQFGSNAEADSESEEHFGIGIHDDWSNHTYFGSLNGCDLTEEQRTDFFLTPSRTPLWKRAIDVSGAAFGLVMLSPILIASSIAVKLTSPGPILFRQLREGKQGNKFYIYKFRTMCDNAENMKQKLRDFSEQDGPAFKIKNDPRLTKVGKYLRRSCIDELPQLLNVLKGDMSLVGPRPLPVNESHECMIWQRKRLEVAPGLTCIWQVEGDRNTKFSEWMRMDMEYIRNRSFLLDMKLILQTVGKVLMHRGSV